MDSTLKNAIVQAAERYPKPSTVEFQYGTAGFRTSGDLLESVLFRVGILAALRSKALHGSTIGVMVTASHNPEPDNGVKLVDPKGEMLQSSWEGYATTFANAKTAVDFADEVEVLISQLKINMHQTASVLYARDTRPSGAKLVAALTYGLNTMFAECRDEGITTTPILHYLVRCVNCKGTKDDYGIDTKDGYYKKLSSAFNRIMAGKPQIQPLTVDCANGVGALALNEIAPLVESRLTVIPRNTSINSRGALNELCGADYVKTSQSLPPSLKNHLAPGERGCSLDGDADRLIYYFIDDKGLFRLLDGDKIAALVADFIAEQAEIAGIREGLKIGVVQTAYANGNSTLYLTKRVPVQCVSTGVKHLHHAAEKYDVGIYFEANGHGTVLFSTHARDLLSKHDSATSPQSLAIERISYLADLINETVGDAISDMLLVESILSHKGYSASKWDSIYADLPNKLVKVTVQNRNLFQTEDAERKLTRPPGLQQKIDDIVKLYHLGRGFVRPSGTENVVRVYAEAVDKQHADELASKLAELVLENQQ